MEKLIIPSILSANNTVMLVDRILNVTLPLTINDTKLLKLHNSLVAIFDRLVKNLKSSSKSELTEVLVELDRARDLAFMCIRDIVGGMSISFIEEVSSKAKKLNAIFEKYGARIYKLGDNAESSMMKSLFNELDTNENQLLLSELNIMPFYVSLKEAEAAFVTVYYQKSEDKAVKNTQTEAATDILKELYPALTKLVSLVQLYSETEPEIYEGALNLIVTHISEANATARAAVTRKQNSSEKKATTEPGL